MQPTKGTQDKQLSIWIQLIKDYCSATRTFSIDKSHKIFSNHEISRTLSDEGKETLFEEMVRTSTGEYVDPHAKDRFGYIHLKEFHQLTIIPTFPSSILVWFHSKDTWAKKLREGAAKNGLLNSVATLYELVNDIPEFGGMDEVMLIRILKVLESSGKCAIMKGSTGAVEGVKFFM